MQVVSMSGESAGLSRRVLALAVCFLGYSLVASGPVQGQRAEEEGPCRNLCTNEPSCGYMYIQCVTTCGGYDGQPVCDDNVNPPCYSGGVPYLHRIKCI
jgi:hypothetical protein